MNEEGFEPSESVFFFVAAALTAGGAWKYVRLWSRFGARALTPIRVAFGVTYAAALALLWVVLARWADPAWVVPRVEYRLLFLAGGGLWLRITEWAMPYLGISPTDDAIERSNPAAACVVCGGLLGSNVVYAGANVGSGATIETTLVPALAATILWFALWALVELLSSPSEAVTIDRDLAAGVRHGAWLFATGVVLGRSVAGDFVSWEGAMADMLRMAWPAIPLAMGAVALHLRLRPTRDVPRPRLVTAGILPAVFFVALAGGYMFELGAIDGPPPAVVARTR